MKEILLQFYKSKMVKILIFSLLTLNLYGCSKTLEKPKDNLDIEINGPFEYPTNIKENIRKTINEQ